MGTIRRSTRFSRRAALAGVAGLAFPSPEPASAQVIRSLPIAWPGRPSGDGFWIRHGFATENTWYNPGWWHCGEDWYALDGAETARAEVLSIGAGEVVFVGSDYPGRVVIVEQANGLFVMYGHLDTGKIVAEGTVVRTGDILGSVFRRTDGRAPSHLHLELRNFLFHDRVNGEQPEHGVTCGFNCAPGPGYWPMSAEHPAEMGWRNPTLSIAAEAFTGRCYVPDSEPATFDVVVEPAGEAVTEVQLASEDAVDIEEIWSGDPASFETSATTYEIWGKITVDGDSGWIRMVEPDDGDTGSDGRPSSVRILLVPERSVL